MRTGIVMLVHTAFDRAEQLARHWAASGCPLVIHVDCQVPEGEYKAFVSALSDLPEIQFSKRYRCEWGTWGLVAATQNAAQVMLDEYQDVRHVYLASGACMPLRPVQELLEYLAARPQTDFIESATTADVPWTVGGLDRERFTMRFPFSWRKRRKLFDKYVALQRRLGFKRKIPKGIDPHMGSQWWCLTRETLSAILNDPQRKVYDTYFSKVWIPDESYFQTLARKYTRQIESRSLTLSKFDNQGKPHVFYDDHLQLLRRSDCFVARKIWPRADALYQAFLTDQAHAMGRTEPNPGKIDHIFVTAADRRTHGRHGLYMQSRFPTEDRAGGLTCAPYSVFEGFGDLYEGFDTWLSKTTGAKVHGHLFAPGRAEFADGKTVVSGALSDSAKLRDYNPSAFLASLIWNTRGERQCFQFGPHDRQNISWPMAKDPNAHISVITGAWAVPLYLSKRDCSEIRSMAARYQQAEIKHMDILKSIWAKARLRVWTLAEFIKAPMEPLQAIIDEISPKDGKLLTEVPKMADLAGFGEFLQELQNQGMHPYLMGDFPMPGDPQDKTPPKRKQYQVK
ncbi:Core-2/I-branching enzyme family protein [hydrothermal vent metagenome]|uniref:Peptide O-xylosyltransferase n=1 Tax=hydrothermal vent metagenome TaxID=652676 RepID=A0A3B0R2G5_9ZZZZ